MWIFTATLAWILYLLVCIAGYSIFYLTENVQVASFSQLLYTLQVSMGGAENTVWQIVGGFFERMWLQVLLSTLLYAGFLYLALRRKKRITKKQDVPLILERAISVIGCLCIALNLMLCGALGAKLHEGYNLLGIGQYLDERKTISQLYENYYQKPSEALIQYPEQKKNLIWIYMESMESTYASREDGGTMDDNLIPNLTRIARENQDFSADDSDKINGGRVTNGSSWTIAGMVSQSSGTPLALGNGEFTKNFDEENNFMPNLDTLGDLLMVQGYQQQLMVGSEAAYAGRANFYSQHGNYEIFDLQTARDEGRIPQNYKEWWGFEDKKLFEYAKEAILEMAASDQPFNFTMLTADTHFKNGYLCEDCKELYDEQMENVIHCSDHRVGEFIDWIQAQDFAEDTVIVLSGDHLNMDGLIPELVDERFERKVYFTVINGPDVECAKTREFTTLDIFPTVAEALGIAIEGHRLGLGTSLYGDVPTLSEELGFNKLNSQIAYQSNYYNETLLAGDDTKEEAEGTE
ncbi:sulfatase-like hydrolase/transferase [Ileibacterium valens]|uniref:sulfatase-like hydrolase/transferase n=1 Tax=Ileibacterium valens TaxID=1862668 RepID=UPI00272D1236|nr:sulfatase-like hydrolase/transferase [Ileibacterium valens]